MAFQGRRYGVGVGGNRLLVGERDIGYLYMYKSRFSKCVKVRPEQLKWLQENRDTKTVAGFLDKIINEKKLQN